MRVSAVSSEIIIDPLTQIYEEVIYKSMLIIKSLK